MRWMGLVFLATFVVFGGNMRPRNTLMWICLAILAAVAVLYGILWIITLFQVWRLTRVPFRRSFSSFIDRGAMPEKEHAKLAEAGEFLLGEGFVYDHSVRVFPPPMDVPGPKESYLNVYHHTESDVYAIAAYNAALARPSIFYTSYFQDGTKWTTCNRSRHFSPNFDDPCLFDDYLPDYTAAFHAHRQRVYESGRQPARNRELAMQTMREEDGENIDRMIRRGALKPSGEGRWRLTWRFAFRWLCEMEHGHKKTSQWHSSFKKHERKFTAAIVVIILLAFVYGLISGLK